MKDEKETLRKTADSIHVMEKFDPAILADVTAPVVSLYIPSARSAAISGIATCSRI